MTLGTTLVYKLLLVLTQRDVVYIKKKLTVAFRKLPNASKKRLLSKLSLFNIVMFVNATTYIKSTSTIATASISIYELFNKVFGN